MTKIKIVFCATFIACLLGVGNIASAQFPVCRNGEVPINGKCSDGNPPWLVASGEVEKDKTTFKEFFEWVKSLF